MGKVTQRNLEKFPVGRYLIYRHPPKVIKGQNKQSGNYAA